MSTEPLLLPEVAAIADSRLDFTRIYGISVMDNGEPDSQLVMARYGHGFTYVKFRDGEAAAAAAFDLVTSVPAAAGAVAQLFSPVNTTSWMLSADGYLTLVDLARSSSSSQCAITTRQKLDENLLISKFAWGSLAPGLNPSVIIVAGRKAVSLFDSRAGCTQQQTIHSLGAKEYVRCVTGTESRHHQLLVSSDSTVRLWDFRTIRFDERGGGAAHPVASQPTYFRQESCTQTTRHVVHPARPESDWLLSINQFGDLSLVGLDWSHSHCDSLPLPVEEAVQARCLGGPGGQRRPDVLGPPRVINSWRDSVMRARLAGELWLEPSVERR